MELAEFKAGRYQQQYQYQSFDPFPINHECLISSPTRDCVATYPAVRHLFIHLVDAQEQTVAQADHQLLAWDVSHKGSTSQWTANLPHLDLATILAETTVQVDVTLRMGLWLPTTGERSLVD